MKTEGAKMEQMDSRNGGRPDRSFKELVVIPSFAEQGV